MNKEVLCKKPIEKFLGTKLNLTKRYFAFDYRNKNEIFAELKCRCCGIKDFDTTMLPKRKLVIGRNYQKTFGSSIFFFFLFQGIGDEVIDNLYFWEMTDDIDIDGLEKFNNVFGQTTVRIPIALLKPVKDSYVY